MKRGLVLEGGAMRGLYLDGGLSDGIPLRHFESIGYERNVVVTTRPRGYRKFPKKKMCLLKPLLSRHPHRAREAA